ncbi:hypothetical protein [uncultured Oceanicoccus sp.]|uniref:hypothetical protein n=1 Tax=uncultured Oceanicoccus sp. TaxID=1706381 RepID=UPI0030DCFA3E
MIAMSTLRPYEQIFSHYDMRGYDILNKKSDIYKSFIFNHGFDGDYQFVVEFYDDGDVNIVAYLTDNGNELNFFYISYSRLDYKSEEDFISELDNDLGCLYGNNTKITMKKTLFFIGFNCYYHDDDRWEFFKSNSYLRYGNFSFPRKKDYTLFTNC